MSSDTDRAVLLVAGLLRGGVRDVVLAPGSRSAPLAIAIAAAEAQGLLRLHVRIDERSAGFLALGLTLRSRAPVAVVTTSGTAPAHLYPAVLEGSYAGLPLLVISADRPPQLHGIGANQTVDQQYLFGSAVRWFHDVVPEDDVPAVVASAVATAMHLDDPGPVHLNVALDSPYLPPEGPIDFGSIEVSAQATVDAVRHSISELFDEVPTRGVIVLGHPAPAVSGPQETRAAIELAAAHGWPLIAEPTANALDAAVPHAPLLLRCNEFADAHVPDLAVVVGGIGLDRAVLHMVTRARLVLTVDPRPAGRRSDPTRTTDVFAPVVPLPVLDAVVDPQWHRDWESGAARTDGIVDQQLASSQLTGADVARKLVAALSVNDQLLVAASWSVRHVFGYSPQRTDGPTMIGNRGTSGIDGLVSTAWGAALGHPGRTYALLGDLAFLHDHNGFLHSPGEPVPDLRFVVCDNDGGGIFSALEQREALGFERVFGTPHGRDLVAIASAAGVRATRVADRAGLAGALADAQTQRGVEVIVVGTMSRPSEAELLRTIQSRVDDALTAP